MSLPIELQRDSGIPIYIQVREQIRLLIHKGVLKPGDPVPTVRALALSLGINLNTVARIYRDLEQERLLDLKRGLETFVTQGDATLPAKVNELRKLANAVRAQVHLAH